MLYLSGTAEIPGPANSFGDQWQRAPGTDACCFTPARPG